MKVKCKCDFCNETIKAKVVNIKEAKKKIKEIKSFEGKKICDVCFWNLNISLGEVLVAYPIE